MIESTELFANNTLISIYFLRASLVLGSIYLLTTCWKKASAAIKVSIWQIALCGLVLLPVLCLFMPRWDVSIHSSKGKHASVEEHIETAVLPPPNALRIKPSPGVLSETENIQTIREESAPGEGWSFAFFEYVLFLWVIGVIVLFIRWLYDFRVIQGILSKAQPIKEPRPHRVFDDLLLSRKGKRPIRLIEHESIGSPMTVGVLRPVIVLPMNASKWEEEQLKVTLLHELAHIDRFDYLTYICAHVVCIAYWMNPFAWIAKAQLKLEQEKACDDDVVRYGIPSIEYAEHLLSIARWAHLVNKQGMRHTIGMANEPMLKKRMRAILNANTPRASLSIGKRVSSLFLVLGMMLPIAAMTFEQEEYGDVYMWYEAEEGDLLGGMATQNDDGASSAQYVTAFAGQKEKDASKESTLFIRFRIHEAGEYVIWGRILAPSRNENSFFVSVDEGEKVVWDTQGPDKEMTAQVWSWDRVRNRETSSGGEGGDPVAFYFDEGWHTLRVIGRERGTGLDRLLITNNLMYRPRGKGTATERAHLDYIWVEPEGGRITEPMRRGADLSASNKAFVWTPENNADGQGSVRLRFYVDKEGEYIIWGRVMAPTTSDNSFFVRLNDEKEILWDVYGPDKNNTAQAWWWDRARDRRSNENDSDRLLFSLRKGWHTLVLRSREAGTQMDRILVTNDNLFVPEGWGTSPDELNPINLWMEAEDADVRPPLNIGRDSGASNGAYIEVTGQYQSTSEPPADGHARFYVDIPVSGTYLLWGRVLAPSSGDSFWLKIDDQRWIRWNGIQNGPGWHWEEVHDNLYNNRVLSLELQEGQHLIELAYREKDTKLDGLLLTNDLNYVPASTLYEPVVQKREVLVSAFRN